MTDDKETTTRKCPKFGSDAIDHEGMGHASGDQPMKYQYECQKCGHIFWVIQIS
jgi:DNA-directed RNA polymerase subunit M/transcription elongation factor TFIIS